MLFWAARGRPWRTERSGELTGEVGGQRDPFCIHGGRTWGLSLRGRSGGRVLCAGWGCPTHPPVMALGWERLGAEGPSGHGVAFGGWM